MKKQKRSGRDPAFLTCAGQPSCGNFILHNFLKTRLCKIRSESGKWEDATEELYSCSKCGAARRWGISAPRGTI